MFCHIGRVYGVPPHVVGQWPNTYYLRVKAEMVRWRRDEARAMRRASGRGREGIVID